MQALLLKEYMKLEVVSMPEPSVGPDDVLVRVRSCGVCGSDVHGLDGSTGRRIPPLVMGHEAAGEVAACGANVLDLKAGDRVTFDSTIYCGSCYFCALGDYNLCDNRQVLGVSPGEYRRNGAFAEYVAVPRRIVYRLPGELTYDHAALLEAVSVAMHGVNVSPMGAQTALVVGTGMIGLLTIQALRASGCPRVVACDTDESRLPLARQMGAAEVFNPQKKNVPAVLQEMTGGRGADLAIECVGATEPIRTAIASVRKGGAVTLVGNVKPSIDLPLQSVVSRQIRLQGSCASNGEYPAAMELMAAGKIRVDPLISATAPLSEGPEWFGRLYRREPNLMKVILKP